MARYQNIQIDCGTDFVYSFDIIDDDSGLPIDLSNYVGTAVAKKHEESNTSFSFNVTTSSEGTVEMTMTAAQTSNVEGLMTAPSEDWVYDVKLVDSSSNTSSKPIRGRIRVKRGVTP